MENENNTDYLFITDGMIDDAELTYIADKLFGEINKGIKADFEEKENAPE